ncbi:hypothetical protein AB3S75_028144 [Citrus x aurantiifolia]
MIFITLSNGKGKVAVHHLLLRLDFACKWTSKCCNYQAKAPVTSIATDTRIIDSLNYFLSLMVQANPFAPFFTTIRMHFNLLPEILYTVLFGRLYCSSMILIS